MQRKQNGSKVQNYSDGYDGYYNDVIPNDANEQSKKGADKSVIANVSVVAFVCVLIVASITVLLTAF